MTTTDEEAKLVIMLTKELTERMKTSPLPYTVKAVVLLKTTINVWKQAAPNITNRQLLQSLDIAIRAILT